MPLNSTSTNRTRGSDSFRFQFDLMTLFWLTGAVAIFFFLWRWQIHFPYWTVVPGLFLLAAWFVASRKHSPDLAWGLFAIGWCWCLQDTAHAFISSGMILGGPPSVEEMQERYLAVYTSSVMLPLYLTFPIVLRATRASLRSYSHARKWLVVCPIVGLLNVTLLTIFLHVFIGLTWPWP